MRSQVERAAAFRALHEGPPFVVPNPWDVGSARVLEAMGFQALATTSSGFAYDPDTSSPIEVILIVGGRWYPVTADRSRSDWATHYGSYGNNHGYAIGIEMPPGRYATCVVALNEGEGRDSYLSCGDVVVK